MVFLYDTAFVYALLFILVSLLISSLLFITLSPILSRMYKALPERYRTYLDITFFSGKDITVYSNGRDRPWIAQHLTDEQWRQHRYSFKEYSYGVGKYKNFIGGTVGWLKCEGLPPITPEMEAELEEWNRQYERQLLDEGMTDELAQWRENKRSRQAAIEAIETQLAH